MNDIWFVHVKKTNYNSAVSVCRKRVSGLGEQGKTEKWIFDVLPAQKMGLNQFGSRSFGSRPIFRTAPYFTWAGLSLLADTLSMQATLKFSAAHILHTLLT